MVKGDPEQAMVSAPDLCWGVSKGAVWPTGLPSSFCDVWSYAGLELGGFICKRRWIEAVSPSEICIWFNNCALFLPETTENPSSTVNKKIT